MLSKIFRKEITLKSVLINIPEIIGGIALIAAVGATGINVFTRYILRFTYFWYADITVLSFFWLTFMSCAAAYRRKMHYGVDAIVNRFSQKGKAVFNIFYRFIILVILCLVTYCIFELIVHLRGKWLPTMHWSYIYCYIPMIAGFVHMDCYSVAFLIEEIINCKKVFRGKEVAE